jgi:hypothetical protein
VTAVATCGVGEVILPLRVTAEACGSCGSRRRPVPGVALVAVLVLIDAVEPEQRRRLVAAGACWRFGDAARSVRSVTAETRPLHIGMRGLGFRSMAGLAAGSGRRAAVLLVAALALAVSRRCGRVLGLVAALAVTAHAPGVRLVAAHAVLVTRVSVGMLLLVTAVAARLERARPVR